MRIMKRMLSLCALPLVAGCLTSAPPEIATWTVEFAPAPSAVAVSAAESPSRGSVRIAQVSVRAPYDAKSLAVLRPNGALAFDPYNQFAAPPAALLKSAVQDAFLARGAFRTAVPAASQLTTDVSAEATVTRLALDCRTPGERRATVALTVLLLKDRAVFASARGEGSADAADGNYSRAFSQAFSQAVSAALAQF